MSDYLVDDLIAEIFERLPPKSLLRCRSLSKSWYYRIVSPDFIRNHTIRSAKNLQKVLIRHGSRSESGGVEDLYTLHSEDQLPLSRKDGYIGITPVDVPVCHNFDIVGSCNGILCLFNLFNHESGITLWNPSIRCKLELPHHPFLRNSSKDDPRTVAIGFGFDPITDDYKVVKISFSRNGKKAAPELLIYTVNTGAWRAIASPTFFSYASSINFICACFVNGALHWVVDDSDNIWRRYIMSFDVSTEVFGRIEYPESKFDRLSKQLMIMEGSLAVISNEGVDTWIWVMKEYKNVASWYIVFKLESVLSEGGRDAVYFKTTNGDFVFEAYSQPRGFKVYNPAATVPLKLVEFKAGSVIVDMEICMESLALLNRGTACIGNTD